MATLREILGQPTVTLMQVQAHLNGLESQQRITECRQLAKKQQMRLWELAASGDPLSPEHMVATAKDGDPVVWYGRNSLPLFNIFEKHFRRHEGAIAGINVQPSIQFIIGPGYYTCRVNPENSKELLVDYTKLPATQASGWPEVKPNNAGLPSLVFNNMWDFCRQVTDEVVIGYATRLGKPINSLFVLCRA